MGGAQFSINLLVGDAQVMSGDAHGGNDSLTATGSNSLWGDARYMSDDAHGGNDRVTASGVNNGLYGGIWAV